VKSLPGVSPNLSFGPILDSTDRARCQQQAVADWPGAYVLNRCSRIPETQLQENEHRLPPGEPCIRQEHVHMQGYCIHKQSRYE